MIFFILDITLSKPCSYYHRAKAQAVALSEAVVGGPPWTPPWAAYHTHTHARARMGGASPRAHKAARARAALCACSRVWMVSLCRASSSSLYGSCPAGRRRITKAFRDQEYRQIRWHHGQSAGRHEMREISAFRFQLHLLGKSASLTARTETAELLFWNQRHVLNILAIFYYHLSARGADMCLIYWF